MSPLNRASKNTSDGVLETSNGLIFDGFVTKLHVHVHVCVLALNTTHVLRLNKADVLALNKAHVLRLNNKMCAKFRANTKRRPSAASTKGGARPSAARSSFVVLCVGSELCAYLIVETQDMCLVESQDICLVETQDMCCVES